MQIDLTSFVGAFVGIIAGSLFTNACERAFRRRRMRKTFREFIAKPLADYDASHRELVREIGAASLAAEKQLAELNQLSYPIWIEPLHRRASNRATEVNDLFLEVCAEHPVGSFPRTELLKAKGHLLAVAAYLKESAALAPARAAAQDSQPAPSPSPEVPPAQRSLRQESEAPSGSPVP